MAIYQGLSPFGDCEDYYEDDPMVDPFHDQPPWAADEQYWRHVASVRKEVFANKDPERCRRLQTMFADLFSLEWAWVDVPGAVDTAIQNLIDECEAERWGWQPFVWPEGALITPN